MNRRGFLRALGLGGAAMVLDPERLLWVPGRVTTFDLGPSFVRLAPANTFITSEWITREALRVLEHNLTVVRAINRTYDREYGDLMTVRYR